MPRLELTSHELVVHLTTWESIWSLRRSFRVPLSHVRGATEDNGFGAEERVSNVPASKKSKKSIAEESMEDKKQAFISSYLKNTPSQAPSGKKESENFYIYIVDEDQSQQKLNF